MSATKTYSLTNSSGLSHGAWSETYETREAAVEALREAMGWEEIHLSHSYAIEDGTAEAESAYATEAEMLEDEEGAYAPQVVTRDKGYEVDDYVMAWSSEGRIVEDLGGGQFRVFFPADEDAFDVEAGDLTPSTAQDYVAEVERVALSRIESADQE